MQQSHVTSTLSPPPPPSFQKVCDECACATDICHVDRYRTCLFASRQVKQEKTENNIELHTCHCFGPTPTLIIPRNQQKRGFRKSSSFCTSVLSLDLHKNVAHCRVWRLQLIFRKQRRVQEVYVCFCFVLLIYHIMTVISLYHSSNFRSVKRDSATQGDIVLNNVAFLYRYGSGTSWNHCFDLFVLNLYVKSIISLQRMQKVFLLISVNVNTWQFAKRYQKFSPIQILLFFPVPDPTTQKEEEKFVLLP